MLLKTLIKLFNRDLNKLKTEVQLYKNEANLWKTSKGVTNSAGNLCLHLVGNLNAFIGAALGHTGYVRQRDLEFSLKNVPRVDLLNQVDAVMLTVNKTIANLTVDDLCKEYPIDVFNEKNDNRIFFSPSFYTSGVSSWTNKLP